MNSDVSESVSADLERHEHHFSSWFYSFNHRLREIVIENEVVAKLFTEFRSFTTSKHEVGQCKRNNKKAWKESTVPSSSISSAIIKRRTSFNDLVAVESSGEVVKGMVDRFAKSWTDQHRARLLQIPTIRDADKTFCQSLLAIDSNDLPKCRLNFIMEALLGLKFNA